jgi:predicted metal-dependent HD superfamily phosphohydrolase
VISDLAATLLAGPAGGALRSRYDEPWRRYHDWSHVEALLRALDAAGRDGVTLVDPLAAVGFVLWHDAIYDPQAAAGRNEELSAALCEAEFTAPSETLARAATAIRATIDHRVPAGDCPDAALLLDVDLSVLGGDEAAFAHYDAGIAFEYAHVPAAAYRLGRAGVLRRFLTRERLFLTDWAHRRWDAAARRNLGRALAALEG